MYNDNELVLIFLSSFEFITWKKEQAMLEFFDEPAEMITSFCDYESEISKIIGSDNFKRVNALLDEVYIKSYINGLNRSGITCITQYSKYYPEKLRHVTNPPFCLFAKGNLELLETKSVAIVGTRNPTAYGRSATKDIAKGLAENGLTIVSGMASGVDGIAHETALECNGNTIAVLGAGFNHIYPSQHFELSKKIETNGLLLTEYKPSTEVVGYNFPIRNRIIAGLSEAVIITEAGEKSGSLHTKEYALDCGRDVYAVPGSIYSKQSFGTNRLIKSGQSICLTDYKEVLERLNIKVNIVQRNTIQLTLEQMQIVKVLEDGEKHFDEIANICKLDTKTLNSCLTTLQIRGIIKKLSGNFYCL